jgi:hypothetical protein
MKILSSITLFVALAVLSTSYAQTEQKVVKENQATQKITFKIKNDTKDTYDMNFAGKEYAFIGSSSEPYEITATTGKVYMYSQLLFVLEASMSGKTLLMSQLLAERDSKKSEFK